MVILVEENDQIEAAFPFAYRKRKGLWFIETPWQVASSGIWMRPRIWNSKEKELKHMTRLAETVIGLLPYYDRFQITFNAKFWTWQPFYWQGFQAVPRYTMTIRDVDAAEVKKSFDKNRRNRVSRGEKRYVIGVDQITFEQYWDFFEMSYRDRGRIIDYERRKMERLICALQQHHALQIRSVYHEDDLVAVNIILMDEGRFYHQFGTQKQSEEASATTYAVYDAICEAMRQKKVFDFEGSMIPGVCEFNSSFNPEWEVQYCIMKESRKYRLLNGMREAARAAVGK